jgi:AcrR family transcriptional regulator
LASSAKRVVGVREKAAETTRDTILRAAIRVFSAHGFDGGSIEKISTAAKSHDRMIYYYFGNKEGLFVAVLEEIYRRFNVAESALELDIDKPVESLKRIISFILNYYQKHPEFVTLLNTENLHKGKHIAQSLKARDYSSPAIGVIDEVLKSGINKGQFRQHIAARDLYMMIAALGYFYQSNRYTLSAFLGENLEAPTTFSQWEAFVTDSVLRVVTTGDTLWQK